MKLEKPKSGPLLDQQSQKKMFSKTIPQVSLKLLCYMNFIGKPKTFGASIFHNTCKAFLVHFGPFFVKKHEKKIFHPKII